MTRLTKLTKRSCLIIVKYWTFMFQKQLLRRRRFLPSSWNLLALPGMLSSLMTRNDGGDLKEMAKQLLKVLLQTRKRQGWCLLHSIYLIGISLTMMAFQIGFTIVFYLHFIAYMDLRACHPSQVYTREVLECNISTNLLLK